MAYPGNHAIMDSGDNIWYFVSYGESANRQKLIAALNFQTDAIGLWYNSE